MNFFKKPFIYAGIFSLLLIGCTVLVLLDTFIIPHKYKTITSQETLSSSPTPTTDSASPAVVTDSSYLDENIQINIETIREYDSTIYIADITLSSSEYLKTALAEDTYGRNVKEKTSSMASRYNAILAINGDFYGANSDGYVIKNGVLYRNLVREDNTYDDLVIYQDGSFGIINETEVSAEELLETGVVQLFAFGPTLIQNGSITVSETAEVSQSMSSNPRTAIGIIDDLHYLVVVSDGRTDESEGLSLYELAAIMQNYGCKTAYNLDGGGSSTLYFTGEILNTPTTNGNSLHERSVSDIVYFGY